MHKKTTLAVLAGLLSFALIAPALAGDTRFDPTLPGGSTAPRFERPAGDTNPFPEFERDNGDGFDWSGAPKLDFEILAMSCNPVGLNLPDGTPLFAITNTSPDPIPKGATLRIEWPVDMVKWFYNPYELAPGDSFNIAPPDGVVFSLPFVCTAKATVV